MFDKLFRSRAVVQRHLSSALLQERLEYLQRCANQGYSLTTLRQLAVDLLLIQNLLGLTTSSDSLSLAAVQAGVKRWVDRRPRHFKYKNGSRGRVQVLSRAVRWLRFVGRLRLPGEAPPAYRSLLEPFVDYLRVEKGLSEGTIRTRHWYVEDFFSWSDVQRLVATTEGSRPKDIRDRAILLLLVVYALRCGEVQALRLDDLDWEKGLLFVPRTKGRKREPYPLSPTVGQAIIRYLREARPRSSYREIFLTVEAPIQPLRKSSPWSIVTKRALSLDPPLELRGPHALRHANATHLLAQGLSLKELGDHLGHRLSKTTAVCAKAALSENLERPSKRASFREEAVRLDSGDA